jgi:hypothetical protein
MKLVWQMPEADTLADQPTAHPFSLVTEMAFDKDR